MKIWGVQIKNTVTGRWIPAGVLDYNPSAEQIREWFHDFLGLIDEAEIYELNTDEIIPHIGD